MINNWKGLTLSTLLATLLYVDAAGAAGLKSFADKTQAVAETIKCVSPKVTKTEGLPDLWGCIFPGADESVC